MRTRSRSVGSLAVAACLGAVSCTGQVTERPSGAAGDEGTGGTSSVGAGGSTTTGMAGVGMPDCTALPAIPRRLWRLSAEQYGQAVKDLLGLAAAPVLTNRGGEAAYAFFSDASLGVDENFQFALYQASQDVLTQVAPRLDAIAPCTGTTASAQTACATTFAQTFGARAFRRPLEAAEVANLVNVYTQAAAQDYNTGIGQMIQALIISPSFVYRTELGPATLAADASGKFPDTTLTPFEVASQLGFLFLGSLPDDGLTAAATDGSLGTLAGVTTQVNRLLGLPAVKANLTGIIIDWFNVRQMYDKTKDTALLSALSAADQDQTGINDDLLTSTHQFVDDALWTNAGKLDELFTSQRIFVNKKLATLYPDLTFAGAAPPDNATFLSATWPASQGRIGMLTQPGFLWSASDPSLTSIVKRGKQIHDDVICQDPLPPPVDLTTSAAVNVISCKSPDGTTTLSPCDSEILKSNARMMYAPCVNCHSQMDPYARVLQNFGPIGNYRTVDEAGRAIDSSVTFVPSSPLAPQTASGSTDFSRELVASGVANGCSVQKIASYAIGSMIRTYDTCEIQDLRTKVDGTIASLFREVALATFTRARQGGTK